MKMIWLIPLLSVLLISCKKDDQKPQQRLITGVYRGSFSRSGMDTADILLTITDNHFEGQGNSRYYPAVCRGSFSSDNHTITFQDSCAWPANFDWSLILNGLYEISGDNKNVRIWRNNENSTDEYILTRLLR